MLAAPNKVFNVIYTLITAGYDVLGVVWQIKDWVTLKWRAEWFIILHYPRGISAKLVIRFEVRSFLSHGYFPKYSHLAILAKLHGPKGDRINESLLYLFLCLGVHVQTEYTVCVCI